MWLQIAYAGVILLYQTPKISYGRERMATGQKMVLVTCERGPKSLNSKPKAFISI